MDMYRIRIKNHLDDHWKHRFGEMTLVNLENGEVELVGPIDSQEALFKVLTKIRDLNIALVSVERLEQRPG